MKNNLETARKNVFLTQIKVSEILKVAKNTISQWENGRREPDYETLKKLSKIYNCSIDYLLNNEVEEKKSNSNELDLNEYFTEKQIELITVVKDFDNDNITKLIGYAEALKQKGTSTERKLENLLKTYKGE